MKNPIASIKRFLHNTHKSAQMAAEIRVGVDNQSAIINNKLQELIDNVRYLTAVLTNTPAEPPKPSSHYNVNDGYQAPPGSASNQGGEFASADEALKTHPLLFAPKTYNTSHPAYDANLVRNFPGKIFNANNDMGNPVYAELKKLIKNGEIAEAQWKNTLRQTLEEVRTVPHAGQVFERKDFVEKYLAQLEAQNGAFYRPGWVNLDDALFLYWVVRKLKPKVIVQTGVCNGLSSAFMMLALAKNGPEGTLHVVDMPPVYDSNDANWKVRGKVYGVTIPEGRTSGWLVPDAYRDRFEVLSGDAKDLLPGLLQKLGTCDMFYHDSDHTYDHMIFEFKEAKKYLVKNGVMVSDDISWNASLWDFADQYQVPAYNYRGSMGIACF